MIVQAKISRDHEDIVLPTKRDEDAGYDIYADSRWLNEEHNGCLLIKPLETVMIPTGVRIALPKTHYVQVAERGSTGSKAIKYGAGIGDSGYRGVYNIFITNCSNNTVNLYDDRYQDPIKRVGYVDYPASKAIAQFLIKEVPVVEWEEITKDELMSIESLRGEGKLGASGK